MSYSLIYTQEVKGGEKAGGESVYIPNMPSDSDIFIFYYPSESLEYTDLGTKLSMLGRNTGESIFVNSGMIGDENYAKIVKEFQVANLPTIVITGKDTIASLTTDEYQKTVYVKFEGKSLVRNTERSMDMVQKAVNFFLSGKIHETRSLSRQLKFGVIFDSLKDTITNIFVNVEEFSFNVISGTMAVKFRQK